MDADRVAQRTLELHEKASMPLSEALALALSEAAPGPIWPIARLFIDSAGNVCSDSHLYAPGLPEGEHDVYPLPVNADGAPIAGVAIPSVTDMQFKLIDAKNALRHAADAADPEVAKVYRQRALEVAEVVSALAHGVTVPLEGQPDA